MVLLFLQNLKWMNCVYVRGDLLNLETLEGLDFVSHVEFADKSLNVGPIIGSSSEDKFFNRKSIQKYSV